MKTQDVVIAHHQPASEASTCAAWTAGSDCPMLPLLSAELVSKLQIFTAGRSIWDGPQRERDHLQDIPRLSS